MTYNTPEELMKLSLSFMRSRILFSGAELNIIIDVILTDILPFTLKSEVRRGSESCESQVHPFSESCQLQ